jgi:hypothetical protein
MVRVPDCISTTTAPVALATADRAIIEPLAVSVRRAAELAGVSRSLLYVEIKTRRLKSVLIRGRRLILICDLRDWLLRHRDAEPGATASATETGSACPTASKRARQHQPSILHNDGNRAAR